MHLPLTIRSPASPLSSQIKLPHPRAKGVCRSSPSHFPLSALCLPIQSKKARLLNTFSGYVLRSPGAGRRWWLVFLLAFCCPRLSVRARGEPAEGPLQDVTPKKHWDTLQKFICKFGFRLHYMCASNPVLWRTAVSPFHLRHL